MLVEIEGWWKQMGYSSVEIAYLYMVLTEILGITPTTEIDLKVFIILGLSLWNRRNSTVY